MKPTEFIKSRTFAYFLAGLAGLLILGAVFSAGVLAGVEKTRFSYSWGENYYRNFGPPAHLPGPLFLDRSYLNPHGSAGQITKISGLTLGIKSPEGLEKNILINAQSLIKKDQADITAADLKVGDKIITFGSPDNQGEIVAKLIRVLDDN